MQSSFRQPLVVAIIAGISVVVVSCGTPAIRNQPNAYQYLGKVVERVDDVDLSPPPDAPASQYKYGAQTAKEALVAEATVAALEKFKTKPSREYQRYTVLLDLGEKVSLRSRVEDIAVGECVRVWIRGPGVSPVYLYDANQAEVEKANGCKP